jgi:GT2 family glycosyltransferase
VVLPTVADPMVSVIVLAYRKHELLRDTLRSLARLDASVPFETVVLLNEATPEIVDLLDRGVRGARVEVSEVNLGFAGGCNRAATIARGEHLVFLNDDVEVQPGWLDALVTAFDTVPDTGVVGSRVLFPDGVLQEAGCVVWSDGVTEQVGRGLPPDTPAYAERRRVDYVSACSMLVSRETWDAVGGFDESYFPGYYEDVDFCFAAAAKGWSILYEPASLLVHAESATLELDAKMVLVERHRAQFRERWADRLARMEERSDDPDALARAVARANAVSAPRS